MLKNHSPFSKEMLVQIEDIVVLRHKNYDHIPIIIMARFIGINSAVPHYNCRVELCSNN